MTYKELVNNIKQIVQDHYMLVDFGYGQISDIKTGGDDGEADYPYAFLNPGSHTRGERSITYRFNLIVMDMYLGDDFLTAQSQCQQYIDDILAEMKYGTQDYDININATLTPFKERFQDVVGGMTATLEIEVGQKLNLCIAPYDIIPPVGLPIIYQISDTEVPGFFTEISSSVGGPTLGVDATIIDTDYLTEAGVDLDVNLLQDGTYRFKYTTTSQNLIDQSIIDATLAANPTAWTDPYGKMYLQSGWFFGETLKLWNELPLPFNTETIGTPYTLTHQFDISLPAGRYKFAFAGQPYTSQIDVVAQWSNVQYQIELVNLDPYEPPVGELALSVAMTQDQLFRPDSEQSPLRFQDVIVDTQNGWRPPTGSNFYIPNVSGTWNWVFEGTTRLQADNGDWPNNPEIIYRSPEVIVQPTTSTWPSTQPAVGVSVPFKVEWTGEYYEADGEFIAWNFVDEPQPEDNFYIETGATLKGYFTPTV